MENYNQKGLVIYLEFLRENDIYDFDDLQEKVNRSPYYLNVVDNNEDENLFLFTKSESSNDNDIVKIMDGMVLHFDNIFSPIFIKKYIQDEEDIEEDNCLSKLPVNLSKCKIHNMNDGTLFHLAYYNRQWLCFTDYGVFNTKTECPGDSLMTYFDIFEDSCRMIGFDYKRKLNPNYTYTFCIRHFNLLPTIRCYRNTIYLYKVYTTLDFTEIFIDEKTFGIYYLPQSLVSTKYQLNNILHANSYVYYGFTVETEEGLIYNFYNKNFYNVSLFIKDINSLNVGRRFLRCKYMSCIDKYLKYYEEDKEQFLLLEVLYTRVLEYLSTSYNNLYIHQIEKPEIDYKLNEKEILEGMKRINRLSLEYDTETMEMLIRCKLLHENDILEFLKLFNNVLPPVVLSF